jgi:hypothetical protein
MEKINSVNVGGQHDYEVINNETKVLEKINSVNVGGQQDYEVINNETKVYMRQFGMIWKTHP